MNERVVVKRRRADRSRHFAGSWKVAYADFVTALMAFFMVMWILGMSEQDRSVIAAYFKDPVGLARAQASTRVNVTPFQGAPKLVKDGESRSAGPSSFKADREALRKARSGMRRALGADPLLAKLAEQVEIQLTDEGMRIELVEKERSAFFASGSAHLLPAGRELIARIAPFVAKTGRPLVIEGHTDAVPYPGGFYTNWDLSQDRATSVRRALFAGGVRSSQLKAVNGYADTRLRAPERPAAAENRRVTILLLGSKKPVPAEDRPVGRLQW